MTASIGEFHLLRYVPGTSPLHRMWAGSKLLAVGAVGIAVVSRPTWAGQGVAAAVLVAALAVARVPLTAFPRPPRWFAIALGIGAAIALASGGSPGFDVGGLSFGLGSLFEWLRFTVLGLLVFSLAIVVGWTTPMADLGPAISRLLTPLRWVRLPVDELVATISLCVRSLPLLIDEMRVLYAVRRLRQQTIPTTVREQVTALVDLLVTALVSSLRRGREMADAIEARGGVGPVPRLPVHLRAVDAAVLALAAGGTVAIVAL